MYVDKEGNNYKGQYLNGKRHGQGKQVTSQRTYEGYASCVITIIPSQWLRFVGYFCRQFKDGQPHGKGIQVFSNGDRYEGDFECDYPHGYGACCSLLSTSFHIPRSPFIANMFLF